MAKKYKRMLLSPEIKKENVKNLPAQCIIYKNYSIVHKIFTTFLMKIYFSQLGENKKNTNIKSNYIYKRKIEK